MTASIDINRVNSARKKAKDKNVPATRSKWVFNTDYTRSSEHYIVLIIDYTTCKKVALLSNLIHRITHLFDKTQFLEKTNFQLIFE